MLVPWGTDAPIYHRPFATGGIILLNCIVFGLQLGIPNLTESLVVEFGTINPVTWVTANYIHAGPWHLIGNMMFLFIFGIIVEGKVGWLKFAVIYNLIGFVECGIEALIFFQTEGGALGASAAIYGIMAIAMIWAPSNDIYIKWIFVFFFRPFIYDLEVNVLFLAVFYITVDFFIALALDFAASSATLHLLGALVGIAVGTTLVLKRQVDCEGYDLIAKIRGREGIHVKTIAQERLEKQHLEQRRAKLNQEYETGVRRCRDYVQSGHYEMAVKRFEALQKLKSNIVMPENWYIRLIEGLAVEGRDTDKSYKLMQDYIKHYSNRKVTVQLRMARYVINEMKEPRRGLRNLAEIEKSELSQRQLQTLRRLARQANQLINSGVIELN